MGETQPKPWTQVQVFAIPAILCAIVILVLVVSWVISAVGGLFGGWTNRPAAIYSFATICTFVSLWLVLDAVFAYLNVGQAKKIEIITGFYTPNTIADYFNQFWMGRDGIRALVET